MVNFHYELIQLHCVNTETKIARGQWALKISVSNLLSPIFTSFQTFLLAPIISQIKKLQ